LYVSAQGTLPTKMLKGAPLPIIPFKEYASLLQKAINRYGGSVLLAGRAGMGQREAASLVANMHQIPVFSPKLTSTYGTKQFRNDLKTVIQNAAISGEQVVFIVEDYHLLHEKFLQSIDSVLSSGDLPGIFTAQEFESCLAGLRDQASQDAFRGDLHSYFTRKVKANLHVVLILNIDSADFAVKCSSNPSLYKECAVIWEETWDKSVLTQVAELILLHHNEKPSADTLAAFGQMYQLCPTAIAPPAKFISFVENYNQILKKKRTAVESRSNRLKVGIGKLAEAHESISKMQKKAAKKSKLLAEKQTDADMALKAISKSMTNANDQRADIEKLKMATAKENEKIEKQKSLIEEQLREVEPLLREAREAVGSIKPESLSEIRSLRAPPEAIRDILQAVLLFMGIFDTSWEAMRK
uniref:AAA_8 domain-containing protein n=1 Tax=Gongylonema pulchrum TaxID=637853 RepID=A0A183CW69_9BILA